MLLSLAATTKRHGRNPSTYIKHLLAASAARTPDADFSGLLADAWLQVHATNPPTQS